MIRRNTAMLAAMLMLPLAIGCGKPATPPQTKPNDKGLDSKDPKEREKTANELGKEFGGQKK